MRISQILTQHAAQTKISEQAYEQRAKVIELEASERKAARVLEGLTNLHKKAPVVARVDVPADLLDRQLYLVINEGEMAISMFHKYDRDGYYKKELTDGYTEAVLQRIGAKIHHKPGIIWRIFAADVKQPVYKDQTKIDDKEAIELRKTEMVSTRKWNQLFCIYQLKFAVQEKFREFAEKQKLESCYLCTI
jgi:hypothetical protein